MPPFAKAGARRAPFSLTRAAALWAASMLQGVGAVSLRVLPDGPGGRSDHDGGQDAARTGACGGEPNLTLAQRLQMITERRFESKRVRRPVPQGCAETTIGSASSRRPFGPQYPVRDVTMLTRGVFAVGKRQDCAVVTGGAAAVYSAHSKRLRAPRQVAFNVFSPVLVGPRGGEMLVGTSFDNKSRSWTVQAFSPLSGEEGQCQIAYPAGRYMMRQYDVQLSPAPGVGKAFFAYSNHVGMVSLHLENRKLSCTVRDEKVFAPLPQACTSPIGPDGSSFRVPYPRLRVHALSESAAVLECGQTWWTTERGLKLTSHAYGLYLFSWDTGKPVRPLGVWMPTSGKAVVRSVSSSKTSRGTLLLALSPERVVLANVDVASWSAEPSWMQWSDFAECDSPSCTLELLHRGRGHHFLPVASDLGDGSSGRFAIAFTVKQRHAETSLTEGPAGVAHETTSQRLAIVEWGASGLERRLYKLPFEDAVSNVFRSPQGGPQRLLVERVGSNKIASLTEIALSPRIG
eukprot:CAMPEP_0198607584 /NCGR_PEP_ID=MMETSP1462-20131121/155468_1 /TAXON_ID=1333877 /ORGANISM="Brandtodinium nutriculum, Strain RCC3387" /LENGTH=515 /DNA_ID=CAMNT_0044339391 /DNA_START=68 /DNA_END=1615 /DNA_ORIENTATION=+